MRMLGLAVLVAVLLVGCAFGPVRAEVNEEEPEPAAFRIGAGAKLLGGSPFAIVAGRFGAIGMEGGLGFSSEDFEGDTVSLLWYSLLARYYIAIPQVEFLVPYASAGAVGLTGSTTVVVEDVNGDESFDITISTLGFDASAGVEFRLGPVAVFGGLNFLMFGDVTVDLGGLMEITVPLNISGLDYHVGVRYDF